MHFILCCDIHGCTLFCVVIFMVALYFVFVLFMDALYFVFVIFTVALYFVL